MSYSAPSSFCVSSDPFAFSFAFYVLIPRSASFNDPVTAILKVISMMVGELEYGDNFTVDNSLKDDDVVGTLLIIFILFVVLVTIIIANLIIALTVSEIDVLYKQGRAIRLHKGVVQVY